MCPFHDAFGNQCKGVGTFKELVRRDVARYQCNVCGGFFQFDMREPEANVLADTDKMAKDKSIHPYRAYDYGNLKRPNLAVDTALNKLKL